MKWFHHECSAHRSSKLQALNESCGMEAIGIFWSLLEVIGDQSDTFHLKLRGLSEESDKKFRDLCNEFPETRERLFHSVRNPGKIPKMSLWLLARNFLISPKVLQSVIASAVEVGLFDEAKWVEYNVLYSHGFEHRADDYTRRQSRSSDSVRTDSGETPDNVRTLSGPCPDFVRIDSEQYTTSLRTVFDNILPEAEEEQKENRSRRRKEMDLCSAERQGKISTGDSGAGGADAMIQLSASGLSRYMHSCREIIREWNDGHVQKFDWQPTEIELRKLFLGGERDHKIDLCYQAMNVQGGETRYAELILRAIRLMLTSSERHRITNPFGWVWSCLHGCGDGTAPWVGLMTAAEESSRDPSRSLPLERRSP